MDVLLRRVRQRQERLVVPWDGRSSNNIFPFCPDVGIAVGEPMVVLSTRSEPTGCGDNLRVLNKLPHVSFKRSMS
jgi:hypothetical protein